MKQGGLRIPLDPVRMMGFEPKIQQQGIERI